jgi:hypothetical protein
MRCSEPGHRVAVAIHASRGPSRWVVGRCTSMLPKDNPESWRCIHEFIDEFPDDDYWSKWKPMVRDVVTALEARGLGSLFRIGQATHDIILKYD